MSNETYRILRYHEFPDIDLYMDQVITYLNKQLGVYSKEEGDIVTPSMINNYVKHGIIPPPEGKKYNRRHLAYMTAVFFLKQALRMDEIKSVIDYHVSMSDEKRAYETFCSQLEDAFVSILPDKNIADLNIEDAANLSLKYSAVAIAGRIYAQKTVELLNSFAQNQPSLKDKEKSSVSAEKDKKERTTKDKKEYKQTKED